MPVKVKPIANGYTRAFFFSSIYLFLIALIGFMLPLESNDLIHVRTCNTSKSCFWVIKHLWCISSCRYNVAACRYRALCYFYYHWRLQKRVDLDTDICDNKTWDELKMFHLRMLHYLRETVFSLNPYSGRFAMHHWSVIKGL